MPEPLRANIGRGFPDRQTKALKRKSIHERQKAVAPMKSAAVLLALSACAALAAPPASGPDPALFRDPPGEFRAIHWVGFDLSHVTAKRLRARIDAAAKTGLWGSFELGPWNGPTTGLSAAYLRDSHRRPNNQGVPYLSDDYFRLYRVAIEEGIKDHFPLSMLYDEWEYPSGIVGGQFFSRHPDLAAKSLEEVERDATGPSRVTLSVPSGPYLGAVLMNLDTYERRDVSDRRGADGVVRCAVPAGRWKLMAFYLNGKFRPASRKGGCVDYLDRQAVAVYLKMSYQKYYDHLGQYFGTVIKRSFYDEPSMHLVDGRMWSPHFNQDFERKYGYSPMTLYPALWYDIGPDTAAARNALFGVHAEEYSENYIGQVAKWCADHGIKLAGHQDQEEVLLPIAISGDLMKVFQHQQIPGIDDIYYPGRSLVSYKIVTSAAFDYDRPECIAETFAAYRQMTPDIALRTILDQAAMGVNMQMDARQRGLDPAQAPLVGRIDYLLRGGRHVADIGMVYPIASLQAAYYFAQPAPGRRPRDPGFTYSVEGGVVPPAIDYHLDGELLYRSLRRDYTYLHPGVITGRCRVEGNRLVLENKVDREVYRVVVLPGGNTLSAAVAQKLLAFYRAGGQVIATSELPRYSAEFGQNRTVRAAMEEIFGLQGADPMSARTVIVPDEFKNYFVHRNAAGGCGYFVPRPDVIIFDAILRQADPVPDVAIQAPPLWPLTQGRDYTGALTYIHKVKDGRDIYFFANTTARPVDVPVVLRGAKHLQIWNPHTGDIGPSGAVTSGTDGRPVTTVDLKLPAFRALFYVGK